MAKKGRNTGRPKTGRPLADTAAFAGNKECITCAVLRGRKRVYSDDEKQRRKARQRNTRDATNEYRRRTVVQARAKRRIIVKRWAESEKGQKWLADYAAKKRAIVRNRRAKQRASEGQHTAEDVDAILKLQRGKCAYCQKAVGKKYHVDHIVSVAKGGGNGRRNLQITCAFCNVSKGERDPIDHARRIGLLI
jgi:5-methylcytosine-specific restriction endonuclease McrA